VGNIPEYLRIRAKLAVVPMAQPAASLLLLIAVGAGIGVTAGAALLLAGLAG
jgi:hypothetical protein